MVISVVWCCARCLCCGLSCCCECCHCLKCCGQCCGCCDPPNGRRRKYLDEPYKNLPADQGYQREDPMSAGALPLHRPTAAPAKAEPPQYASFDVSKDAPGGEDALPAMPTWGDSESKKIGVVEESVELQQLKPEGNGPNAPLMNGMSPAGTPLSRTPVPGGVSPYGPPGSQAASSGFFGGNPGGAPGGAVAYNNMPGQGYDQMHNGYAPSPTSFHTEQSWGVTGGPMGQEYGQGHPQGGYAQHGYTQEPVDMQYGDKPGYSEYGAAGAMGPGYGRPPPGRSMTGGSSNPSMMPARSMTGGSRGSPVPQQGQFAQDRQFDARIAPARTYSPSPQQQGQFPGPPQRTFSPAPVGGPQRTYSPGPRGLPGGPGGPGRTFSPAPGGPRGSPAPQRQWSADAAGGGPRGGGGGGGGGYPAPGPRAPPYRQYSTDSAQTAPPQQPSRQFSESPRPMAGGGGGGGRGPPPPVRGYTASDVPSGPRSPNFSRPTRSNTLDGPGFDQPPQEEQSGAYPGYKPYQPAR